MIRRLRKTTTLCALLLSGMGMLCLWKEAPPTDLSGASLAKSIFLKQAAFLAVGTAALGLSVLPNYQHYRRWAWGPYLVLLGALAGLLLAGRFTRGARGWYALGPVHLQPAEFMKVALVLVLARLLMHGRNLDRWRGLVPPILATALPAALILLQPDLGTAILFIPTLLAMLYAAGSRKRHLAAIVLALAAAAPVGYLFFLKEYQRLRLASFLHPDTIPAYQQKQSVMACASGGLTGRGLGEGGAHLPFYVPDRHTDFVFSIVCEEMGFAGATFVLLLFAVFFSESLQTAYRTREPFGRLIVVGLTTLLVTQSLINLGMTLGVAPITGLTLPFVSYGGSSLLTCMVSTGLILNVAGRWQPGFSKNDLVGGSVEIREFRPPARDWQAH